MNEQVKHTHYMDFLQDEKFIIWQLTRDVELKKYWDEYIKQHPESIVPLEKAISIFKKNRLKLTHIQLTIKEKETLLFKIKESSRNINRKRRFFSLAGLRAAAACVLLVLGIYFYINLRIDYSVNDDTIIGKPLEEKVISFTTSTNTISFTDNIQIKVNDDGEIVIYQEDSNAEVVVPVEQNTINQLTVPYGKRSLLTLGDNTKIWMNSGSTLNFPANFSGEKREVSMTGEVYFEVEKDNQRPFYVHADDFTIKVYGTSFNVSSYHEEKEKFIVLVDGSVSIQSPGSMEEFLKPNELAVFTLAGFDKKVVDVQKYTSWKNGYLIFEDATLTEVLKHISRYYNLSFHYEENEEMNKRMCNGKIYLSENLDNVLKTISILSSTHITADKNEINIK